MKSDALPLVLLDLKAKECCDRKLLAYLTRVESYLSLFVTDLSAD